MVGPVNIESKKQQQQQLRTMELKWDIFQQQQQSNCL